jgi:predicted aminopeptidase
LWGSVASTTASTRPAAAAGAATGPSSSASCAALRRTFRNELGARDGRIRKLERFQFFARRPGSRRSARKHKDKAGNHGSRPPRVLSNVTCGERYHSGGILCQQTDGEVRYAFWVKIRRSYLCLLLIGGLGYYFQAIRGEYQILAHRRSIEKLIADSKTPAPLKQQLQLVQKLRAFAKTELQLPADGNYEKYVDVHRKYVVWDVQAAPPFSLTPKVWRYPFVGGLAYRGYFSEKKAQDYGAQLRKEGFDVYIDGVEAYSTLGWFKDPLLNTFINDSESELAELLFHELAHKRVFASGDTDFNEAYATAVGEEGARRWLRSKGDTSLLKDYEAALVRERQFVRLVTATREQLAKVYADRQRTEADLRRDKQQAFDDLLRKYAQLKLTWGGFNGYDEWFAHDLNNAKLNTVANYFDDVPGFDRLLQANSGDMAKFHAAVERLSKKSKDERRRELFENSPKP